MRRYEIAVAGCGPAGLSAALMLARDGHRVTLFERFDVPRPIGSGLMIQPTGLAVLRTMGLAEPVLAAGARIERLIGEARPSGRTVLDVRYSALGPKAGAGLGIHRAALFSILHEAVLAGAIPIETGRTIVAAEPGSDGRRRLRFADGTGAGPFDLVVDALGSNTPLAPKTGAALAYGALWASLDWPDGAGFDPAALAQRYVRASVMVGVLPIGRPPGAEGAQAAFFWSIRLDRLEAWRRAGLEAWKAEVLTLWPETGALLDQIAGPDQLTPARYHHRTVAAPAQPGLIHLGDAWHSASPQLGQGANMALMDAFALAKGLRETDAVADGLERAVSARRRHVRLYQAMTALFTPVYQSDSRVLPLLRDRVVGPASRLWPATVIQAAMVSGLVGSPLKPLGLDPG
ncbi:2-polyprenyl-6-methoxyphenol hydroxylase-like FAD-dependent oxidoreductase [Enterovirga rhinocerotis]|uniref:2-polyprenyl-6-methoxyphenol hydroxylase-like FAD-dependent oxidoreductase n=2 Tax=Enterovirga rhinocerotis TaxID=1339210 RepID=A0A4R7BQ86_9HYPH|nr:2-polyprenyl-6-methoxyphenol hydroxylase-like FAD-dependent oxidoreductase [Enterovirga rhinocerotis]